MWRPVFVIAVALLNQGCSRTAASDAKQELTCPEAQITGAPGLLKETPRQIQASRSELGQGRESEISRAAASIRARHPDASSGEIVNYLVAAYCPTVSASATSDLAAKREALRKFSMRVRKVVPTGS